MKIILTFSFWFITLGVIGQKPFNKLYDFGFLQAGPRAIEEIDGGYLIAGQAFVDTFTARQLYMAIHKYNGEVIDVGTWKNEKVLSGLYDQGSNNVISLTEYNTYLTGFQATDLGTCVIEASSNLSVLDTIGCFTRVIDGNFYAIIDQILINNNYYALIINPDINGGTQIAKINLNQNPREIEFVDISPENTFRYFFSEFIFDKITQEIFVFGTYKLLDEIFSIRLDGFRLSK